jgi:hypothetical protein
MSAVSEVLTGARFEVGPLRSRQAGEALGDEQEDAAPAVV